MRLTGSVNTVRGTYDFQGRRFDVLREGGIHFEGLEDFDPRLDLRTRRLIQGVEAHVDIRGTLQQPEIVVEQHPASRTGRHSRADRVQPAAQPARGGAADVAGARAQSLATGALAGTLVAVDRRRR